VRNVLESLPRAATVSWSSSFDARANHPRYRLTSQDSRAILRRKSRQKWQNGGVTGDYARYFGF
jgi:hypothetical protein